MIDRLRPACLLVLVCALAWGCSDDPVAPEPPSVQARVDAASPGDTVLIQPGVYTELHDHTDFIGRTLRVFCVVKPGVVVRGATGDPADVIVDGGGEGMGFWFHQAGSSTGLAAVTVRNATWAVSGYDASPWIADCILEDNGDVENNPNCSGTAIYFDRSNSVVTDCVIRNNATTSGAVTFSSASDATLRDCLFVGNSSTRSGGGLVAGNSSMVRIIDCELTGNTAAEYGGAVYSHGDSIAVVGGRITGNGAGTGGGGVALRPGPVLGGLFDGVTITGNTASEGAQGWNNWAGGEVRLLCCVTDPGGWSGAVTFDDEGCERGPSRGR